LKKIEKDDAYWMRQALAQARAAARKGEVPVGAVLVRNGVRVAAAHNRPIAAQDPSAHAEILALRRAARRLKNYRLDGTILYVTLEPCAMCAGALVWARIAKVVYGCSDLKAGACGTILDLSQVRAFNHRFEVSGGVLAEESRRLLQDFFRKRRKQIRSLKKRRS
jgi:tRNA(adenine34) deaminase